MAKIFSKHWFRASAKKVAKDLSIKHIIKGTTSTIGKVGSALTGGLVSSKDITSTLNKSLDIGQPKKKAAATPSKIMSALKSSDPLSGIDIGEALSSILRGKPYNPGAEQERAPGWAPGVVLLVVSGVVAAALVFHALPRKR